MPTRRSNRSGSRSRKEDKGERTIYGKAAVVLIAAIPMLATIGYGSADLWALIPLSILTALLLGLWAADSFKAGEFRYSTSAIQFPLLALVLLGCIQLLPLGSSGTSSLTLDPFSTRYFIIRLVLLVVFLAAALRYLESKRQIQRVVLAVIIFGSLLAFAGILQRLASPDAIYGMRPTPQAIPFGPFVNQHHFAAFMEMTVGLGLAALLGGTIERDKKSLALIALSLMLIAVALTGSRGGVISMLAVFAFALVATYAGRPTREPGGPKFGLAHIGAGAALLIAAGGTVIFLAGTDPLVRGLGMQSAQEDVTSGRLHFWSIALQIFRDNPVLGAGLDAFGMAFPRYDTWNGLFRVEQAHNDYLQMLADGGIAAFACIAVFIFLLFRRGLNVIRRSSSPGRRTVAVGALAGCFGVLVHSFFDFPLRTPSNSYFFLLLTAFVTVSLGDEREEGQDR